MVKLLTFLCGLMVLSNNPIAEACVCAPPVPPKKALESMTNVFSGKVTKIERTKRGRKIVFKIDQTWKAAKGKTISVETVNPDISSSCGYRFKKGEKYLVYAYKHKNTDGTVIPIYTSICTRTKLLADAKDDLKELGEGKKPKRSK